LLEVLMTKTEDAGEKEKLEALLQPGARQEMMDFLSHRELADLLEEFPGVRFSAQDLVDHLKRLVPRLYSIASSPMLFPDEVHLTVAVVRYRTNNRDRVGVCSTYLAERAPLHARAVPVFLAKSHFRPPEDAAKDIIMVGPGTGIAPFRAFLQERIAIGAPGRNWLFFGDQRRDYDFLYGEEFERQVSEGKLHRLSLAFSRDQEQKVYVQDRMVEEGRALWEWIDNGAYFYVCGDAQRMAKDVDLALHRIARDFGGLNEEEAANYIKLMRKEKRYQRDVY
jgi:sulfite reductase (NADPH) flavoprotein alpha-component